MAELPYDIWLHIASYLPPDTLWGIRYLNSCLLNIALDQRYEFIYVDSSSVNSSSYARRFLDFRDENVSKRIKEVIFLPNSTTEFPGNRISISDRVRRSVQVLLTSPHRTITQTIAGFSTASSLQFQSLGYPENITLRAIPVFNATLRACFGRLRMLIVQLPGIPHFARIFQHDLFFPHLTSLAIGIASPTGHVLSPSNTIQPSIVPFINRHRLTLTELSLGLSTDTDGASPFVSLNHIPSLKSVALFVTQSREPLPISHFLNLHSATLQKLMITPAEMSGGIGFIAKIFQGVTCNFPDLRKFTIQHPGIYFPPDLEYNLAEATDFIRRCASKLVELRLANTPQSMSGVSRLFGDVQGGARCSFECLRILSIDFRVLAPEMLDILALHSPNLRELNILAARLKPQATGEDRPDDEKRFCFEMIGRRNWVNYTDWKLEEIYFSYLDSRTIWSSIGAAAMAIAMTSLRIFNNIPVAEYISQGQLADLVSRNIDPHTQS